MDASAATTVHRRPEVIQTLNWRQYSYISSSVSSSTKPDSLQTLHFDFYNGALARIVVGYDPVQVQALTVEDIAEAISNVYGRPSLVNTTVVISEPGRREETRPVLARWEDPNYSYSLFSAAYGSSFGVVAVSKRLDLMATVSCSGSESGWTSWKRRCVRLNARKKQSKICRRLETRPG
jgi:hypothetical protein